MAVSPRDNAPAEKDARVDAAATGGAARPAASRPSAPRWLPGAVGVALIVALWQAACSFELVPSYLLPSPVQVVMSFVDDAALLGGHCMTTLYEAALGLGIGVALGFVVAVLMDRFGWLGRALDPIVTVSQTIPTIALAPLLVLWFGFGIVPKVVLVVLTTFFPVTVGLARGFRSVDPDVVDLMRTMRAKRWQVFWYAKLPAAAGQFFSGLRISATYAIVGAVIAEWLGGFSGLGVYMIRVRKSFSYDRMFAAIILISALSLGLMALVDLLERICTPWRRAEGNRK